MSISQASRHLSRRMLAAVIIVMSSPPASADGGIDTPQCKEAVSRIAEATGATFDHASPSGNNVFMAHPAARSLLLSCRPGTPPNIDASVGQAFPPDDYFALIAGAGAAVTKVPRAELEEAIRGCQRAALTSADEEVEIHRSLAEIDCTAFTRDGGSTSILVAPEE